MTDEINKSESSESRARSEEVWELASGMLSRNASFRLIVSGNIGVREIERLIRKLELDKECLIESDDRASDTESSEGGGDA